MKSYIELLRLKEWHRNITVIIGIIFAFFILKLNFNLQILLKTIIITFLACLISSANYILNAIVDMGFDKKHPIKQLRPLPTKRITPKKAYSLMLFLIIISLILCYLLFNIKTTISLLALLLAAIAYNLRPIRLKDIPYIDVISESINNPIRFLIGWFILADSFPNLFLLLITWSLACLLMTKKRLQELNKFKQTAVIYRNVYKYYSVKSLKIAITSYIIISIIFSAYFIKYILQSGL